MDHNKLWKIRKEMGIPDHLNCLLRYLYSGHQLELDMHQLELDMEQQTGSKSGKGYIKTILSPCLFNLYAEYIMGNLGLAEAQSGIKTAGRNINNLRYADDTSLMAGGREELKSLLMKVKEESEKVGLNSTFRK